MTTFFLIEMVDLCIQTASVMIQFHLSVGSSPGDTHSVRDGGREHDMSPTVAEDVEKAKAETIKARNTDMEKREKELNAGKTGKGTRTFLGMTRGRNPIEIQYEQWDEAAKDSLPVTLSDVIEIHKSRGQEGDAAEKDIVRRWVLGDNDLLYAEASDPISEFVDKSWPDDVQKQFRLVVRNYSVGCSVSIEDAVAIIKPGFSSGQAKTQAAE
jgi:hypothetical protein